MKAKKKEAIVDILGGFGNQLFQLSFANYLRSKDYKVLINLYNFRRVSKEKNSIITNRELMLPLEYFGFQEVNYNNFIKYDLIDKLKLNNSNIIMSDKFIGKNLSWFNDTNLDLNKSTKFNRFTGYWQNLEILNKNKEFLIKGLSKNKQIREALDFKPLNGSTALHVRRTDYISMGENLNEEYYKSSIEYGKKNIKNFHYEIFTDDVTWVGKKDIFRDAEKVNPFIDNKENTITSFANMLKNENFIIANSSFSFFASFLKEAKDSKVLYPDPWFKKQPAKTLSKNIWIPIKNN